MLSGAKMKSALVTGANGDVGRALIGSLASHYELHLATWHLARDMPPADLPAGSSITCVDIQDLDALTAAMKDITAVVHLAGEREFAADWADLRGPNIDGVYNLFEAARRNNVEKVVFASSNHATGYLDEHRLWPIAGAEPPRPDSLYGVTKAFGEVFGRYASDYYGMSVICLRLGWVLERPHNEMALRMWLSHGDLGRLVIGALESTCRYGVYFGVSANRRRRWDLTDAERDLGYVPQDDSEQFAAELGL
jgi:NAD+ dependent glucose-6-phosphate dehydrogenase